MQRRIQAYVFLLILALAALMGSFGAAAAETPVRTPEEIIRVKTAYKRYKTKLVRWRRVLPIMEADMARAQKSRTISRKKVRDLTLRLERIADGTLSLTAEEIERTRLTYNKYKTKLVRRRTVIPIMEDDLARAYKSRAICRQKVPALKLLLEKLLRKEIGVGMPEAFNSLPTLENRLGRRFDIFLTYQSIREDFNVEMAEWLWQRGTKIQVAWEPHRPDADPGNQSEYRLKTISRGDHDPAIYRWARQIKAFGHPVYFRPMCEMNSDWTAWGAYTNGNQPEDYIPAWRRVRRIFKEVGADNAQFIWSPNRAGDEAEAVRIFEQFYPGSEYVDYVGINGYNWGGMYSTPSWSSSWMSFSTVFGPSYNVAVRRTSKRVFIAEMATTEVGGSKAAWIEQTFKEIRNHYPRIKSVVWFNYDKETDWRIDAGDASIEAFRKYAFY